VISPKDPKVSALWDHILFCVHGAPVDVLLDQVARRKNAGRPRQHRILIEVEPILPVDDSHNEERCLKVLDEFGEVKIAEDRMEDYVGIHEILTINLGISIMLQTMIENLLIRHVYIIESELWNSENNAVTGHFLTGC